MIITFTICGRSTTYSSYMLYFEKVWLVANTDLLVKFGIMAWNKLEDHAKVRSFQIRL